MAAVGDIKSVNSTKKSICLMAAQGSATTVPTLATHGLPTYPVASAYDVDTGAFFLSTNPTYNVLTIHNSAGSGSLTGVFTLYGYLAASGVWYPIKVNGGSAVTGTTTLRYVETYTATLGQFDRITLDVQSPGGTGQQFEAWLTTALENHF